MAVAIRLAIVAVVAMMASRRPARVVAGSSSLETQSEFLTGSVWALPESSNVQNYVDAWTDGNIAVNLRNSIAVTLPPPWTAPG